MPRWIVQNVSVWWLTAIGLVCLPALTIALLYVIRRRSPQLLEGHQNEAVGYQSAVVGVVYAVIVGFMVITLWDQYTSAGEAVQAETSDLRDLAQFSQAFGPAAHGPVQGQAAAYAESVATSEWPAMARGGSSPATQQDFDGLVDTVQRLRVRTLSQQEFLGSMLTQINDIGEERQERLDLAGQNIPGVLWLVVILSSAGTLVFSLLLGIRSAWLHYFMVGTVTVLIGASLVLALQLEYPFSGSVAVHSEPYQQVAHDLRTGSGTPAGAGPARLGMIILSPRR